MGEADHAEVRNQSHDSVSRTKRIRRGTTMRVIVPEKQRSMQQVRMWTASNGRCLEVMGGVVKSINDEGIKAWSQPVVSVFPFSNLALVR